MSDLVLRDELLEDFGKLEVGLVLLKLHPVDESRQLVDLLSGALVVAAEIFRQLLFQE